MESQDDLMTRARNQLKVAEQLLVHTYPIVKEPKILLGIAEDIYAALTAAMNSLLKKKGVEKNGFDAEFRALTGIAPGFGISPDELDLLACLHRVIEAHKSSPVEFPRPDCFVICDGEFNMITITIDNMKSFLFRAGLFVEKAESVFRAK